ncbi:hypothetical protein CDD83_949 [Cordyceps sp. RAO-2017]|nr:hypothetical protein CDD83_949 [Cordyceps sp. RAO-2017]
MRLISTATFKVEEFLNDELPPYAILSHTWGEDEEEVTLRDIQNGAFNKLGNGYIKLQGCCEQAKKNGLRYAWIDTCCINKESSSEIEEAINSMFQWYSKASVCYAFLSDVFPGDTPGSEASKFSSSRWFGRGWTLQELLAPTKLCFYDQNWTLLGTKTSLSAVVEDITGIPRPFLLGSVPLSEASVAQRMSWAAKRRTKRREDIAYCLLGIFRVNMPMIYGEGDDAFRRLQEAIMKNTGDESILAWGFSPQSSLPSRTTNVVSRGVLATSPADFANCQTIVTREFGKSLLNTFEISAGHLRAHLSLHTTSAGDRYGLLNCGHRDQPEHIVGVPLASAEHREPSNSSCLIRPQGCPSILFSRTASRTPPTAVYVRTERPDTATDRRYWFYIDDSKTDLKLIDVYPRFRWKEEWAMIATTYSPDSSTCVLQRSLARFRTRDRECRDVIVVLEFQAQQLQRSARYHVMTCSGNLNLADLSKRFVFMDNKMFGKQGASYGRRNLSVTVKEELIGKHPRFVVRLATVSTVPEITVDATRELRLLGLRQDLVRVWHQEERMRPEVERVCQDKMETMAAMASWRKRLGLIEEELKGLIKERIFLSGAAARSGEMLQTMLDTDTIDVDLADMPDDLGHIQKRSGQTPLLWAASNGHHAIVKRLLADGCIDLEQRDEQGRTPLWLAAERGDVTIVKTLLDLGADCNVEASDGSHTEPGAKANPPLSRDAVETTETKPRAGDTISADWPLAILPFPTTEISPVPMPENSSTLGVTGFTSQLSTDDQSLETKSVEAMASDAALHAVADEPKYFQPGELG